MFYPHDKSDIKMFTPAPLAHLPKPPVYYLRAATVRDRNHFQRLLIEEGAQSHGREDVRDEVINGLKELATEEDFGEWEPRIKAYWDAMDSFDDEIKTIRLEAEQGTVPELPTFEYEDEEPVLKVLATLDENWRPLRKMTADNVMANRMQAVIMAQIIITKVDGGTVELQREGKYLSFETAGALREEVQAIARENDVDANAALNDFDREVLVRLFVPKSAEKNSASPSPSSSDLSSSKVGTAEPTGTSTTSETSTPTPSAS